MWRSLALIAAVAVAAFEAPRILQQFADEPHASPVAAKPISARTSGGSVRDGNALSGRSVRLQSDRTGHYHADAKMNNRRVRVLVDTGATLVALNESAARRLGIRLKASDFKYRVSTANGTTAAAAATIGEVRIGRVSVRDVRASVLRDEALDTVLLGMSFLGRLKSFRVERGELVLIQ